MTDIETNIKKLSDLFLQKVRLEAKDNLVAMGISSVPALIDALAHEDLGVRNLAAEAMEEIGKSAIPALQKALKDRVKMRISAAIDMIKFRRQK